MFQSKFEANTFSLREAREKNVRTRLMIGFGFTPHWMKNERKIFKGNANYFRHSSEIRYLR